MWTLLGVPDVWDCVTTGYEELSAAEIVAMPTNQLKGWTEKHMKDKIALYMLFQSVYESRFKKIVGAIKAKDAWEMSQMVVA